VCQVFAQLGSASGKGGDFISWLACTSPNRPFEVGTLRRRATRPSKRVMPPTVLLRNTLRETLPLLSINYPTGTLLSTSRIVPLLLLFLPIPYTPLQSDIRQPPLYHPINLPSCETRGDILLKESRILASHHHTTCASAQIESERVRLNDPPPFYPPHPYVKLKHAGLYGAGTRNPSLSIFHRHQYRTQPLPYLSLTWYCSFVTPALHPAHHHRHWTKVGMPAT